MTIVNLVEVSHRMLTVVAFEQLVNQTDSLRTAFELVEEHVEKGRSMPDLDSYTNHDCMAGLEIAKSVCTAVLKQFGRGIDDFVAFTPQQQNQFFAMARTALGHRV